MRGANPDSAGVHNVLPAGRLRPSPVRVAGAVHAARSRNPALVAGILTSGEIAMAASVSVVNRATGTGKRAG